MDSGVRNNLRAARARLGLSQQVLAASAGVTRQTVGGIEGGLYAPSAAVALRLAKALACRVEDLFWLEEDLPDLIGVLAGEAQQGRELRVTLAEVGGRWVAHPLHGAAAFRSEMVPCDGLGTLTGPGSELRVRPLGELQTLRQGVVLAGCTPALSLWARAAERWHPGLRVHWTFANSTAALHALGAGEVHGAGVHLGDPDCGEDNTAAVARTLPGREVVLVNLGVWEEGMLLPPGNPKAIRGAADLARPDIGIVNREIGSGSRRVLDDLLHVHGVPSGAVRGYDRIAASHQEVAEAMAAGVADAGVSSACVAAAYGLDFLPVRLARYDMVFLKEYLNHEPVRQLLSTLDHRWVRSQLSVLGGYDTSRTGEVVAAILNSG